MYYTVCTKGEKELCIHAYLDQFSFSSSFHIIKRYIKHSSQKVCVSWRILWPNIRRILYLHDLFKVISSNTSLVQNFLPDIPDRWFADAYTTQAPSPLSSFPELAQNLLIPHWVSVTLYTSQMLRLWWS